jgi:anthranilate/para-aminobenzoate synthase component I
MGKLRYTTRDINDPDTIKTVERETYEDAVKKVKEEILKGDLL